MEKALQERGWYLSNDGIERCKEGLSQITADNVIKAALDIDLREIGSPALQELIIRGKDDCLNGPLVLQIQKVRNVSAPKANEKSQHAPKLLRLYVTDGCGTLSILQGENWTSLKLFEKPPGTKILVKSGAHNLKGPLLQLDSLNITILGGKVDELIEKWKINMSMSHRIRSACGDVGPPPWVPFGSKIEYSLQKGSKGSFKSLDTGDKENVKETQAFDEQRKATIAEISKSKEGVKKVFGKGKHEDTKPVDARRRDNRTSNSENRSSNSFSERKPKNNFRRDRADREESVPTAPSKPSTIFDFLETKIKEVVPSKETPKDKAQDDDYQVFESSYNNEGDFNRNQRGGRFRNEGNYDGGRNRNINQKGNRNFDRNRDTRANDFSSGNYGPKRTDFDDRRGKGDGQYHPRDNRPNRSDQSYSQRSNWTGPPKKLDDACPQTNPINFPELGSELVKERDPQRTKNFSPSNNYQGASSGNLPLKKPFAVGDHVMARYWEDRKFYNATIFATSEGSTCVVQFTEYGNYEEVLVDDVFYAGGGNRNHTQRDTKRPSDHDTFNVPSYQARQSQQLYHEQQSGEESADYNAGGRRRNPHFEKGAYSQPNHFNNRGGQQESSSDGKSKSRTYKPSLQYYQPPRQRPQ